MTGDQLEILLCVYPNHTLKGGLVDYCCDFTGTKPSERVLYNYAQGRE